MLPAVILKQHSTLNANATYLAFLWPKCFRSHWKFGRCWIFVVVDVVGKQHSANSVNLNNLRSCRLRFEISGHSHHTTITKYFNANNGEIPISVAGVPQFVTWFLNSRTHKRPTPNPFVLFCGIHTYLLRVLSSAAHHACNSSDITCTIYLLLFIRLGTTTSRQWTEWMNCELSVCLAVLCFTCGVQCEHCKHTMNSTTAHVYSRFSFHCSTLDSFYCLFAMVLSVNGDRAEHIVAPCSVLGTTTIGNTGANRKIWQATNVNKSNRDSHPPHHTWPNAHLHFT